VRVVVDTNLLISLALSPEGRVARIRKLLTNERFSTVASPEILDEYARALRYPRVAARHKLSTEELEALIFLFAQEVVEPEVVVPICRDEGDDKFFAAALAGRVDYIVSDDPDLHAVGTFEGIRVVSSGAFLALLEREGGETS